MEIVLHAPLRHVGAVGHTRVAEIGDLVMLFQVIVGFGDVPRNTVNHPVAAARIELDVHPVKMLQQEFLFRVADIFPTIDQLAEFIIVLFDFSIRTLTDLHLGQIST